MKSSIFQSAMQKGWIMGGLFSANFLLSIPNSLIINILTYLVIGFIIYFTHKFTTDYRDHENEGVLSFGKGFSFILLLYLFSSIISAGVKYVFFSYISPDFLPNMMNQAMVTLEQLMPSVPQESYDTMETLTKPINYTLLSIWVNLFFALFIGVVVALVVKRNSPQHINR